jgi:hypothetical protein
MVEKDGSLGDPSYIAALPTDHLVVALGGLADVGAQRHQFKLGTTDLDGRNCEDTCIYPEVVVGGESTANSGALPRFVRPWPKGDQPTCPKEGRALTKAHRPNLSCVGA